MLAYSHQNLEHLLVFIYYNQPLSKKIQFSLYMHDMKYMTLDKNTKIQQCNKILKYA